MIEIFRLKYDAKYFSHDVEDKHEYNLLKEV